MAYDLTILEEGCQELGITLDEVQKKQFTDFYEYLVEKNKVMNLTGITELLSVHPSSCAFSFICSANFSLLPATYSASALAA